MNDEAKQDPANEHGDAEAAPTRHVALLIEDVRALVRAELNYYQTRLTYSRQVIGRSLAFGAVAAAFAVGAAVALVVGLVLTLAPLIGPGLATLAVTLGFVIIGSVFAVKARNWARKVYFPEIDEHADNGN